MTNVGAVGVPAGVPVITARVTVDDDGAGAMVSNECDETDNTAELTLVCSGLG